MTPISIRPGRSWGRYPTARHSRVLPARWRDQPPALGDVPEPLLPSGCGRSYGDSGLNADGALIDATGLDRFIELGDDGLLRCEAGCGVKQRGRMLRLELAQALVVPEIRTDHVTHFPERRQFAAQLRIHRHG